MTREPKPTSRARQREETRRRVYEAAITIIRRDGFDSARIEDIVKRAGVSSGAFYFHFPTKDEVLVEMIRESSAKVAAAVEALPSTAPLTRVLAVVCSAFADNWRDDLKLFSSVGMVAIKSIAAGRHDVDAVPNALAPRFAVAATRGEITRKVPAELLNQFFLLNLFAAAVAGATNPQLSLDLVLPGVVQLFLDGAKGS